MESCWADSIQGRSVIDEVKEFLTLPPEPCAFKRDPNLIKLSPTVCSQLRDFVTKIAFMYNDVPFHSFARASHVGQSVTKLLARVVIQDTVNYRDSRNSKKIAEESRAKLHAYTYGITSDPLTQFACAFSAVIHDVGHTGVPNSQLVKEQNEVALHYKNKSVAEQHSVDIAWALLMEPAYKDLRACIYSSQSALDRFRQLVVNGVMATDSMGKEMAMLRAQRWEKAFLHDSLDASPEDDANRKATIVIEHLIQASDVAHTMQHWHIFIKWNERLFHEMYQAHLDGRAENDPSTSWYENELGFFDHYILPLANKLKECGVFGVASDEYFIYAQNNRREWEAKGRQTILAYMSKYKHP